MNEVTAWIGLGINLGIGGVFLWLLFNWLGRGTLRTQREFDESKILIEQLIKSKDERIRKLEEINEKLDTRNDILSKQVDKVVETSRANGMIEALPPTIGERVIP